ncbi:PREDICTED: ubiquitin-conjugating enzyme E2 U isoform X2 [Chinchilla lanigera]|uniref:ubiquitin-conjugating enzyme E2 U isoform X2 n=1 Tax=Chinchilla lanigera TaxID=34839 RepID=UPI000697A604|nr:PREDICTED: ubiquitin-conjugating enzyme E2 U isoform X2 [Chinchilla lanigera]
MHSRAYALLQRDFRELMEKGYPGITAFPLSEDMMAWKADIEGLQNSIWQGLVFDVAINFTPGYNSVPPAVRFVTIPFHPNVNPDTGEPCIDFLNNSHKWNPKYTLSSILLALQVMLSNPVTENPVNLEAAQMLSQDEAMYQIVLRRLFQRSLQLDDGSVLLPKHAHELTSAENRTKARTGARPPKVISFDDYHKTWCGIATSKATESHRRPCKCLKIQTSLDNILNGRRWIYNILKNGSQSLLPPGLGAPENAERQPAPSLQGRGPTPALLQ